MGFKSSDRRHGKDAGEHPGENGASSQVVAFADDHRTRKTKITECVAYGGEVSAQRLEIKVGPRAVEDVVLCEVLPQQVIIFLCNRLLADADKVRC